MRFVCVVSMLAGGVLLAGGCATGAARYRIVVSNAASTAVSNVVVQADNTVLCRAGTLGARAEVRGEKIGAPTAGSAVVRWTPAGGEPLSKTLDLTPADPESFRGRIYLQIEEDPPDVRVFFLDRADGGRSDLPWNERQTWEAAPSIPGFNQN